MPAQPKGLGYDMDSIEAMFVNGLVASIADDRPVDMVKFFEDSGWADWALRPRQRLLIKVIHNAIAQAASARDLDVLPWERVRLDTRKWWAAHVTETNEPPDMSSMVEAGVVEQTDDGAWWYDEGKDYAYLTSKVNKYANMVVNITGDRTAPLIIVLVIGRGGTKTTMAGGVSAWSGYRVMTKPDPHAHFGLEARKALKIQNVATAEKQAQEFFQSFKSTVGRVPWFKGRYKDLTNSLEFGAIPNSGRIPVPQLVAALATSNSRSGRGGDVLVYIHDEMAFADKGGEDKAGHRSDRALWDAYYSATKTRFGARGMAMCLSSPAEADGLLYELFTQAHAGELPNVVLAQISTWEMIPGHTRETYDPEYKRDPDVADMEYGAQFHSGDSNLITNAEEKIARAVMNGQALGIIRRRNAMFEDERLMEGGRYQRHKAAIFDYAAHLDTSKGGDRLTFAITHMEGPWTVLDHFRVWDVLPHYTKELEPYVRRLDKAFGGFRQLSFDQYNSLQLIQNLTDAGIKCIERTFTAEYNDAIARNLMNILGENPTLAMYGHTWPHPITHPAPARGSGWDSDETLEPQISMFILGQELKAVKKIIRAKANSNGKVYLIAAVAPTSGPVIHDDAVDALAASAYEARLLTMAGGAFDMLDPNEAYRLKRAGMLIDPSDPRSMDEASGPAGLRATCIHCAHAFVTEDPNPFVACPGCGEYTQTRLA